MMIPNPVKPPPVMFPRSLCVKPNWVPQSPRIPPRMENPPQPARLPMKPPNKSQYALGAMLLFFPLLIVFFFVYYGLTLGAAENNVFRFVTAAGLVVKPNDAKHGQED